MLTLDEPMCLPVGTEVSAKYRGAFCEAKVKKITKKVKVKVNFKEGGNVIVPDEEIKGTVMMGATVEVKHPETAEYMEGTVMKVTDASMYTVVFDDGDENTLRRTQLCLKGEKHFVKMDTLDELPLTHPEHFGIPVMKGSNRKRRRSPASALSDDSDTDDESSEEDAALPKSRYASRLEGLVGRVVLIEQEERKRTLNVPVLITQPSADNSVSLKTREHVLVKSFKDGKFYSINRKSTKEFIRTVALKNEDKVLKTAMDRALNFFDKKELPSNWAKEELLGSESEDHDEEEEEEYSSDGEPNEEKDHFVAQLYKFMDDMGTPINKMPALGKEDLDLFRLFRIMQSLGGWNKVCNKNKWQYVANRLRIPPSPALAGQVKAAYRKYLFDFEGLHKKLGSSIGTILQPIRSHRTQGTSRSFFREKDRDTMIKSPGRAKKKKDDDEVLASKSVKEEKAEKTEMKTRSKKEGSVAAEESETESDTPRKRSTRGAVELEKQQEKQKVVKDDSTDIPQPAAATPGRRSREDSSRGRPAASAARDDSSTSSKLKDDETTSENGDDNSHSGVGRPPRRRMRKKRWGEDEESETPKTPATTKPVGRPAKATTPVATDKPSSPAHSAAGSSKNPPGPPSSTGDSDDTDKEPEEEEDEADHGSHTDLSSSSAATSVECLYPTGSKLRIKYPYEKGKQAKIYDAKVLNVRVHKGVQEYRVHYAGWNARYDEWVNKDPVVAMIERGSGAGGMPHPSPSHTPPAAAPTSSLPPPPTVTTTTKGKDKKPAPLTKQLSQPGSTKASPPHPSSATTTTTTPLPTSSDSHSQRGSKSPTPTPSKPPRPTRSSSMESPLVHGLPPRTLTRKRRTRKMSGVRELDTQSRGSSISDSDASEDESPELIEAEGKLPIIKSTEKDREEDDEGPPKLQQEGTSSVSHTTDSAAFEFKEEESTDKLSTPKRGGAAQLPGNKSPRSHPVVEMEKVSEDVVSKNTTKPSGKEAAVTKPATALPTKSEPKVAPKSALKENKQMRLLSELKEADSGKDSDISESSDLRTPIKRRGRKRHVSLSETLKDTEDSSKKEAEKDSVKVDIKEEPKLEESEVGVKSSVKKRTGKAAKAAAEKAAVTETKPKSKSKRKLDIKADESEDSKSEQSEPAPKNVRRKLAKRKWESEESTSSTSIKNLVEGEEKKEEDDSKKPSLIMTTPTKIAALAGSEVLPVSPPYKPAPQLSLPAEQERNSGAEGDDDDDLATAPHLSPIIRSAPSHAASNIDPPPASDVAKSSADTVAPQSSDRTEIATEPSKEILKTPPRPQQVQKELVEEAPTTPIAASSVITASPKDSTSTEPSSTLLASPPKSITTNTVVPVSSRITVPLQVETSTPSIDAAAIPPTVPAPAAIVSTSSTSQESSRAENQVSPVPEGSTKSEHEANLEVASIFSRDHDAEDDSNLCERSTLSADSGGGSSGNAPSSESDDQQQKKKKLQQPHTTSSCSSSTRQQQQQQLQSPLKRKHDDNTSDEHEDEEEEEREHEPPKRRRRGHKRAAADKAAKRASKVPAGSDSDGDDTPKRDIPKRDTLKRDTPKRATLHTSHHQPAASSSTTTNATDTDHPRPSKYNFTDLSGADFLEGDKKIEFIVNRMKELQAVHAGLKKEVNAIDKKKKRLRRKREAASANSQQEGADV